MILINSIFNKILKNIIKTSKDIGFKTLCEGIETKEHEDAAIEAGCDFLQGFYCNHLLMLRHNYYQKEPSQLTQK